jgi:hypothetical protein
MKGMRRKKWCGHMGVCPNAAERYAGGIHILESKLQKSFGATGSKLKGFIF